MKRSKKFPFLNHTLGFLFGITFFLMLAMGQVIAQDAFMVCGDSKLLLVDYKNSRGTEPKLIWTWDAHLAEDLPVSYRNKKFNSLDDCKLVNHGKEILVSS